MTKNPPLQRRRKLKRVTRSVQVDPGEEGESFPLDFCARGMRYCGTISDGSGERLGARHERISAKLYDASSEK
jgi:hypothetical protein